MGNGAATHRRRGGAAARWPRQNLASGDVHPVEQQLQMILRVGFLGAARLIRAKRVPFLVGHGADQAQRRKHHHSAGHPRDPGEQCGDGGGGRGDPCGDRETRWRPGLPALGGGMEQAVAALGKVDASDVGERDRPLIDDRAQPIERDLPMGGQFRRIDDRVGEPRRINLLDHQSIERSAEIGGEPHRFGSPYSAGAADQSGEAEQARQRVDCGRDRHSRIGRVERTANAIIEIGIADRDQSRQEQTRSAGADKRLGHGPNRAIIGQQHAPASQRQWVAAVPGDYPGDKRVGERAVRGNSVDKGRGNALRRRLRHGPIASRSRGSRPEFRRRTTGPDAPRRSSVLRRSPDPRTNWSRMVPRARRR